MDKYNQLTQTYEIYEKLNSGGGGTIYRAFHKRLQKDVIIKVMHGYLKDTLNSRAEADILKKLRHSYLPQVLDYFEENGTIVTVMDYIPGKSFKQLLDEGKRFKQRHVIKWAIQLCEALEYLHSQNPSIIHSDIKPANVMLMPNGDICLIDFNISSFYEKDGAHVAGYSDGYSPPEQYLFYTENNKVGKQDTSVSSIGNNRNSLNNPADEDRTEVLGVRSQANMTTEDKTEVLGAGYQAQMEAEDKTEVIGARSQEHTEAEDRTEVLGARSQEHTEAEDRTEVLAAMGQTAGMYQNPAIQMTLDKTEPSAYAIVNERSDIYSLGATLYHMLTGVCPAKSTGKVNPVNTFGKFSDGLIYIISKAMQLKPQKRFQSAGQMLKALKNINRLDRRYKNFMLARQFTFILMLALFTGSILSIYYGNITMKKEKNDKYRQTVEVMSGQRESGNYDELDNLYKSAVDLFPNRVDAYYQKALALYELGRYDDTITYVEGTILENSYLDMGDLKGDIYYILGNCYYEKDEYGYCADYLQKAVYSDDENLVYYTDYAVALAKDGDIEEANQVLETAMQKGIADSAVFRIKGEINLMNGEFESGEQNFLNCIKATEDDYTRMRAYLSCSQLYDAARAEQITNWKSPGVNQSTEDLLIRQLKLLQDAKARLPVSMTIGILESLAQTNINCGIEYKDNTYLKAAISVFDEIVAMKWDSYLTHKNLAVLYRQLEDIDSAWKEAEFMLEEYGEDYYIYSLFALLECDRQIAADSSNRDFGKFMEYYDKSVKLYEEQAKDNENRQEMMPLYDAYNLLTDRGWIKED
jgi:eukaryotic-like serine/threonine-protein kinase